MRTATALLAALLLAPCACARHGATPPLPTASAQEPAPAVAAADPAPALGQAPAAEPEPKPTPEEVAAFHARVPK
jgi:hypothetical protein